MLLESLSMLECPQTFSPPLPSFFQHMAEVGLAMLVLVKDQQVHMYSSTTLEGLCMHVT